RLRSPGEHAHWRAFQFLIADPDTAGWSTFQPANPAHFSTGLDTQRARDLRESDETSYGVLPSWRDGLRGADSPATISRPMGQHLVDRMPRVCRSRHIISRRPRREAWQVGERMEHAALPLSSPSAEVVA
ncbi:MAG: hypothetical protein JWN65_2687, partial [Solirubrobacterales bacterium]|nr:hypothetical protein [Solirubrobacterales bacterium]